MTGYHVTTTRKVARYKATGAILPPVRFWRVLSSARVWGKKTGRDVILEIEVRAAYPLPDHRPRGHAWWADEMVREWKETDDA